MLININSKEDWDKFGDLIESGLLRSKARWESGQKTQPKQKTAASFKHNSDNPNLLSLDSIASAINKNNPKHDS